MVGTGSGSGRCEICGDGIEPGDLNAVVEHLRTMHPERFVEPDRWPDGALVFVDDSDPVESVGAVGSGGVDPDGILNVALRDLRAELGDDYRDAETARLRARLESLEDVLARKMVQVFRGLHACTVAPPDGVVGGAVVGYVAAQRAVFDALTSVDPVVDQSTVDGV